MSHVDFVNRVEALVKWDNVSGSGLLAGISQACGLVSKASFSTTAQRVTFSALAGSGTIEAVVSGLSQARRNASSDRVQYELPLNVF